ncbi:MULTISPECIES: signal recognition particle protein [unclassified Schlesneria]|uniref:signal recognition particle protein n=1 Tax=Schlesneria TaxID=656899 RepID=UPI002EE38A1E
MFEGIAQSLKSALSVLGRGGKLTEANIRDGMAQVRKALLEADVHYDVATNFIKRCTELAVGDAVLKSLRPDQQIVGIVHQQLVELMGPTDHSLHLRKDSLGKIMMCGLQGSGKTTTCGKLARMLKEQGKRPMLVAADLQRPAAIEQLKIIGQQLGVPVHSENPAETTPLKVCANALTAAKGAGVDVIIFDTAGRLHVDQQLMKELEQIDRKVQPDQILLVCDAMTGQDAVNSARAFNEALELDGVILTKLDGDTRGGAAISVKEVTGVPIKFIGMGEQLDKLEPFHPDRMAGRILGMGDIVTLFEKAAEQMDEAEVARQQAKMAAGKFTLEDFRDQMKMIRRMGSLKDLMKMIPGLGGLLASNPDIDAEGDMNRIEAVISSMTPYERTHPDKIDRSRRHRIARGAGTDPADVNRILKDFHNMANMAQKMSGLGSMDRMKAVRDLAQGGMVNPAGGLRVPKERSKRGPADQALADEKRKKARKEAKKQKKRNR